MRVFLYLQVVCVVPCIQMRYDCVLLLKRPRKDIKNRSAHDHSFSVSKTLTHTRGKLTLALAVVDGMLSLAPCLRYHHHRRYHPRHILHFPRSRQGRSH